MNKQIALFGGSFDPPTLGHMMVISHLLLNDPIIDEVWVIPCFQQSGKNLSPYHDRFYMAQAAFEVFNRVRVDRIEETLGGESLTYRTVEALHKEYPHYRFRFVIGSDLRDKISTWEGGDIIERFAPPLTVGRAGIPDSDNPTPICPAISSTIVRKALDEGRYSDCERYLSLGVMQYILENKLYIKF